jgi:flagellar secretion chaperone FliS
MSAYPRGKNLSAYQSVAAHGGVAASDPHGLILMLLDGALDRIASARGCIVNNSISDKNQLLTRAYAIVEELRYSLDLSKGGPLAANLGDLYDYVCRQLSRANAENRVEILDEVTGILQEIRVAWIAIPQELRASRATFR